MNICIYMYVYRQIDRQIDRYRYVYRQIDICKKYKSENQLKLNKRIVKTAIKSNAKIFPIYN